MFVVSNPQYPIAYATTILAARAQIERFQRIEALKNVSTVTPYTYEMYKGVHIGQALPSYPLGTTSPARYKYMVNFSSHNVPASTEYPCFLLGQLAILVPPCFYWGLLHELNRGIDDMSEEKVDLVAPVTTDHLHFDLVCLFFGNCHFALSMGQAKALRTWLLDQQSFFRIVERAHLVHHHPVKITPEVM